MPAKRLIALALVALLVAPPCAPAALPLAMLTGHVTSPTGSPLTGLDLELLNLDTGRGSTVQTDGVGAFRASLEAGPYRVEAPRGYIIVRGPQLVKLVSGEVASADLVLAQDTPASPTGEAHGKNLGNIVAVTLFSGALIWVVIRVATNRPEQPSPSR